MDIKQVVGKLGLMGTEVVCYNSFSAIVNTQNDGKERLTRDGLVIPNGLKLLKAKKNKIEVVGQGFEHYSMNDYFTFVVEQYSGLYYKLYAKEANANLLSRFTFVCMKGFVGDRSISDCVGVKNSKVVLIEAGNKGFLLNYKGKRLDLPKRRRSEIDMRMLGIISRDNCNTYEIGYGRRDPQSVKMEPAPVRYLDFVIITVDSELNVINYG